MRLSSLVSLLERLLLMSGSIAFQIREHLPLTEVDNLVSDSRKVTKGSILLGVEGEHSDGHDFRPGGTFFRGGSLALRTSPKNIDIPQLICPDVRRNMGRVALCCTTNPLSGLQDDR